MSVIENRKTYTIRKRTFYAIFKWEEDNKILVAVKENRDYAIELADFLKKNVDDDYEVYKSDGYGYFGRNAEIIYSTEE